MLSSVDLSNANLAGATLYGLNLHSAVLRGADVRSADLRLSNFRGADFNGANMWRAALNGAELARAKLHKTDLNGARLYQADFTGAELSDVSLTGADLRGAIFHSTILRNVDFTSAGFGDTVFARVDLRSCRGLSECSHSAPSTIGVDTIYASHGDIPEAFLRKAGLSDAFLVYAKSLIGAAIQLYSCFISYSTEDKDFADRLYADLEARDVRCWYAPHDMQGGRKVHEQIDEAIRLFERLLLVLSPHSMSSEWVKTEISKARKREVRESARVLFPIRLTDYAAIQDWECFDADTGKD
ncbi:MAG: toll/interleukin-1 receptor domain-containing protein, partial [Bryobacteraceae bacterium]